ncbi:NACHT domain-containing protein [Trichoderma breve]|uniref:NACHT domain-containing protein n=1 Tax=Trichoderma breve TaxID=2034170 RepID=A0A9W9BAC5_9HYPO|nr:NACHT domain-containing protein [Trichoderma breve]KAJ4859587.1 NACHT domain-containing protein [Trichoderma breve]
MLPAAVPRACLMLYNWPAKFYTNAVDLTLHDLAEGLWLDIHARRCQRREPVYRPILFIASCFGGLALHSAASKTSTYSYLRDATVGIVFLGTPFNGTPMQRQAQWLIAYGNLRREETSSALVENLAAEETNAHLKELVDDFAISVNSANFSIPIHCFYETQKTNLAKKALPSSLAKYMHYNRFIVDKNSASLRGFQSTYLNCTHVMMNKFAPGTNEYDRIRNVVVGFVKNSRNVLAKRSPAYELETLDHPTWFTHTSPYVAWYQELRGVLWHRSEVGDQSSPLICVANRIEAACTNLKALYFSGLDAQTTEVLLGTKPSSYAHPNQVIQTLLAQYFQIIENDVSELKRSLKILIDNSNDLDDLKKMMATGWMSPSLDVSRVLRQLLFLPRDTKFMLVIDNADFISSPNSLARFLDTCSKSMPVLISGTSAIGIDRYIPGARIVDRNTEYTECLESLRFAAIHLRRDKVASADEGTNDWIFAHNAYKEFQREDSGVLWIEGKAGSGKSVLAKFLLQKLQSLPNANRAADLKDIVVDWFYSRRDGEITMAHSSMLRSIVYKVFKDSQETFNCCKACYQERQLQPDGSSGEWSFDDLQCIIKSIVSSSMPIICILDGLDESAATEKFQRTLMRFNSHVESTAPSKKCHKIILQHENRQDILRIIDNGLVAIKKVMESLDSLDEDNSSNEDPMPLDEIFEEVPLDAMNGIRTHLINNAKGVILWVTLIIDQLMQHCRTGGITLEELERLLHSLPHDLMEYYEYMVKELEQKLNKDQLARSRKALMWVSGTSFVRALTIQELWDALAIPEDVQKALESRKDYRQATGSYFKTWAGFRSILYTWCGPFIEVMRDTTRRYGPRDDRDHVEPHYVVQLLHQTVKDFLADEKTSSTLRFQTSDAIQFVLGSTHIHLQIVLPQNITAYTQFRRDPDKKDFMDNLINYLNNKWLLRFSLEVFSKRYSIREAMPEMSILSQLWGQINTWYELITSTNQVEGFVLSACLNGKDVALQNLLHICISPFGNFRRSEIQDQCLDGALVAAARIDSPALVRRIRNYKYVWDRASELRKKAIRQGKLQLAAALGTENYNPERDLELQMALGDSSAVSALQYDLVSSTFGLRRLMASDRARKYGVQRYAEDEAPVKDREKTEQCIDELFAFFKVREYTYVV